MTSISNVHSQAHFHKPAPHSKHEGTNPAISARAALEAGAPALKNFGSLVSLFARGLPLPPVEEAPVVPQSALVTSAPPVVADDGTSASEGATVE